MGWICAKPARGSIASRALCGMRTAASNMWWIRWPAQWASDTILVAHEAFAGLSFQRTRPPPNVQWTVAFNDHTAYLWLADISKRKQLAKGGARLAELLNAIWP